MALAALGVVFTSGPVVLAAAEAQPARAAEPTRAAEAAAAAEPAAPARRAEGARAAEPRKNEAAPRRPAARGGDDARPDGSAAGAAAKSFGPVRRLGRELSPTASGQVEAPAAVEKAETQIAPGDPSAAVSGERPIAPPRAAAPRAGTAAVAGPAPQPRAQSGVTVDDAQLNDLRSCRVSVLAERKGKKVLAGKLNLRWTVLPDGTVQNPDVVAVTDTDPAVMACIERKMADWRFARPPAAVQMTRSLAF